MGRLVQLATTQGTFASDSSNDPYSETYLMTINMLRVEYGDPSTEGTFLTNIDYDGDYELALVGTIGIDWEAVPGYDTTDTDMDGTPDKDEDAIDRLNLSWAGPTGTFAMPTERGDGRNAWTLFYNGWNHSVDSGDMAGGS